MSSSPPYLHSSLSIPLSFRPKPLHYPLNGGQGITPRKILGIADAHIGEFYRVLETETTV
jgi:hypothetical protein